MLAKIKAIVQTGWFLTLVGLILLSLIVWFVGPLIEIAGAAVLAGVVTRLIVIVLMFAVWGLYRLAAAYLALRRNRELVETLGAPAGAATAAQGGAGKASGDDKAVLERRLDEALGALKTSKFGQKGDYLYQLPWYIIIGPPAAGKTTALLNSGLSFPLAEHGKGHVVKGIGGTQRCDWWFTNEAVLVDTAGRYATQDSQKDRDAAEWLGFLDILKKRRPRQPLNGVIVAISATDLSVDNAQGIEQHSAAIRARLDELNARLGVRLPVYVMITKTDLLAGFTDFFETLDEEARAQVWGVTFQHRPEATLAETLSDFGRESDALAARLADRLLQRLQDESDLARRVRIFGFPQQFADLRRQVQAFLGQTFEDSRFTTQPILRGVYFTSGTQQGTPIDRLLGALAKGITADRAVTVGRSTAKSFFVRRLLKEVVFAEAGLVGTDPRAEKRQSLVHMGAIAAGAAILLAAAGLWTLAYVKNSSLVGVLGKDVAQYRDYVASAPKERDAKAAFAVPALNLIREAAFSKYAAEEKRTAGFSFGLGQDRHAGARLRAAYQSMLRASLLPRILAGLEGQLGASRGDPDTLFEVLRVYLMAGGQGPMDTATTLAWLGATWERDYPGAEYEEVRKDLLAHAEALFAQPIEPQALDAQLIEAARAEVRTLPRAKLAFSQVLFAADVKALPAWSVFDHAGPEAAELYAQPADAAQRAGVPGIFTRDGYYKVAKDRIKAAAESVSRENWVLGADPNPISAAADTGQLRGEIEKLYFSQFVEAWNGYFASLAIVQADCAGSSAFDNQCLLAHADKISLATGPSAPLKTFLTEAAKASDVRPEAIAPGAVGAAADAVAAGASSAEAAVARLAGGSQTGEAPIQAVIREFEGLRALVEAPEGGASRLDRAIDLLKDYGEKIDAASGEVQDGTAKAAAREAANRLQRTADDLPVPARQLFLAFAGSGAAAVSAQSRQQIAQAFAAQVAGDCANALSGRFPFDPGAQNNLLLGDFTRLFGPGGVLETFFNDNLRRYTNMATKPWSLTPEGESLGLSPASVRRFQNAEDVRKDFFGTGSLGATYTLNAVSMDQAATKVRLVIDGSTIEYAHSPPRPVAFSWPGAPGSQGARIVFDKAGGEQAAASWDGEWALLRMLKDARVVSKDAASITFDITVKGTTARFTLQAQSVNNPFTSTALQRASCRGGL